MYVRLSLTWLTHSSALFRAEVNCRGRLATLCSLSDLGAEQLFVQGCFHTLLLN